MKNFVKLIQQVHEEKFSAVMNRTITQKIPVAFMSIAPIAQAVEIVKNLRAQGLNITNLIVNDSTPPPTEIDFNVIHVSDKEKLYPKPEYILTVDLLSARIAAKKFTAAKVVSINNGNTEGIYNTFMAHLDELREVYESLIDEDSRKTFCGYWLGKISNQISSFVYSNAAHYLINGFIPERGAIAIDCGVFDGGTATVFSQMGYKVYGFEMDKRNYAYSLKIAEEKNFALENLGLGSYKHIAKYNPAGSGSKLLATGSATVEVTTLDSYVREKNLPSVDFIKMDVEGAELDILKGAKTSIARFKPILALSAYHKLDDFWTLTNFIKSVRPDYEFALRHSFETPEEEPANFNDDYVNYLVGLGLEPDNRNFYECVLFAR